MAGGRPTLYTKELLEKAREYLSQCEDIEEQELTGVSAKGTELFKTKLKVDLPTIEGLAYFLQVNRDTIYEWEKEHPEFSDIIADLRAKQAQELINKGLSGDYNPTIAKVLLTKHGYREGIDQTSDGKGFAPSEEHKALADKAISTVLNDYERDRGDTKERQ